MIIVQSELHWPTAQRLEDEGAAICLGRHEAVTPTMLRQAVQKGHRDVARLKEDSDLGVLRPRPDFQKLLAELDAKAPKQKG